VGCAHGDIDHVGVDRIAVALTAAEATLTCRDDFRPRQVVLERTKFVLALRGVADDATILGDECDPAGQDFAEAIGFPVEAGLIQRSGFRQQIRDEIRLVGQVPFNRRAFALAHLPDHQAGQCEQRQRGGSECPDEDLRAKPRLHPSSVSIYCSSSL
jgi:hypothetical protein